MTSTNIQRAADTLTDGTGVSPLTLTKVIKDFVADFLITAAAAVGAVQLVNAINGFPTDIPGVVLLGTAILGAAIKAGYRAILRWATTE